MSLYRETFGQGQPLILLHGWGMHGGMFQPVVRALSKTVKCIIVDLPGHGHSEPFDGLANIDSVTDYLTEQLADVLTESVSILGWSMSSLIAQNMVARLNNTNLQDKINKLILVTGTPCFQNHVKWKHGVEADVLNTFNDQLLQNFDKTLNRFLALQFMHADEQKENLKLARELVAQRPAPDAASLKLGLELLKQTDLRDTVKDIHCPTLIINGERDTLIPTPAAKFLAENIRQSRSVIFKGSGHAPFLSHYDQFTKQLKSFLS